MPNNKEPGEYHYYYYYYYCYYYCYDDRLIRPPACGPRQPAPTRAEAAPGQSSPGPKQPWAEAAPRPRAPGQHVCDCLVGAVCFTCVYVV